MSNHPNRSNIVTLKPILVSNLSEDLRNKAESEFYSDSVRFWAGTPHQHDTQSINEEIEYSSAPVKWVILGFLGERFCVPIARGLLIDSCGCIKPDYEREVLAIAMKQVVKRKYPDRMFVQVEPSLQNGDKNFADGNASIWWNRRRQYEQNHFNVWY